MPYFDIILNLPNFTIVKTSGYNPILHDICWHGDARCPHCDSRNLRKKDRFVRVISHESVGLRKVLLRLSVYKYRCRDCGKYFRQRFEGILPWQRSTEAHKKQVYHQHSQGISRKDLSRNIGKSDSTVARWYDRVYDLENRKLLSLRLPTVLGIDEHSFSRRKKQYATTFCDLQRHRIFDVALGKSRVSLQDYMDGLKGKNKVRVVCMDLSETYRSIARNAFPNALIVADRFHVVRLALHHLLKTCQAIDPELKWSRGVSRLLRKHSKNLRSWQAERLQDYFVHQPAVAEIYRFKEQLMWVLLRKNQTKTQCKRVIPKFLDMIKLLRNSGFEDCQKLGKTLQSWSEEIGRMWRFSKSNGITEGFHRKMKLIQRRAFGFRNFENYRRRVRVLCA